MEGPRVIFRAGDWPHRVAVQRVTYTFDDGGGTMPVALTTIRSLPCMVVPQPLSESPSASRREAEASFSLTFYSNPGVRNGDRFIWKNRLLVVKSTNNEYGFGLIFSATATEIVP